MLGLGRVLLALAAVVGLPAGPQSEATPRRIARQVMARSSCSGCWVPPVRLAWQIQLSGALDTALAVDLIEVDAVETTAATVDRWHGQRKRVMCYVNAGAFESWRPDAVEFPSSILGSALDGWPGERWLDVREVSKPKSALARILRARVNMCADKGFDAIDFDNVDGYANASGFALTARHQLTFNRWLAAEAHARNLAVALKNDLEQVPSLVDHFDLAVNEQCHEYGECDALLPFVRAGKPVLQVEYSGDLRAICAAAARRNFNVMKKSLALDASRTLCP